MKKIIFIFLSLIICNNYCFADISCNETERRNATESFFYKNANKQIGGKEFSKLDEQTQREARIRNLCFGSTVSWYSFCSYSKYCKVCDDKGYCDDLPSDKELEGITLEQYCKLSKTDCFKEDINTIMALLDQYGDYTYKLFNPDMNDIIRKLSNGENESFDVVDTDNSVCYRTDSNGDTIWHAMIRSNHNSITSWANLCASYLKFDKFSDALYNIKNKKGISAFKEVLNASDTDNELFFFLSAYARQEGINYNNFVQKVANANNVSISDVQKIIKQ